MLITAVTQLEEWTALPLKQVAHMLEAVKQLMTHFKGYTSIAKIVQLVEVVSNIEGVLSKNVKLKFAALGDLSGTEINPGNTLSDTCLVVDALGTEVRSHILSDLVHTQLGPYDVLFAEGGQHFTLDDVERRWAWFKRVAKNLDNKFLNVIPQNWGVLQHFCVKFCVRTKQHMLQLLQESGAAHDGASGVPATTADVAASDVLGLGVSSSGGAVDVSALLKALQTTLRFEEEMSKRFESAGDAGGDGAGGSSSHDDTLSAADAATTTTTGDSVGLASVNQTRTATALPGDGLGLATIAGAISTQFDGFLKPYVLLERGNLDEMISRITREEADGLAALKRHAAQDAAGQQDDFAPEPPAVVNETGVLHSSTSMFVFVKNSIKRCTALSTGQTFYLLSKEFKNCLTKYCSWLAGKLPTPLTNATTGAVTYRLTAPLTDICHVVNTCEYCAEVVPTLEAMIRVKLDAQYCDGVDLNAVTEQYLDLSARAAKTLVGSVATMLEPGFRLMAGVNWGALETVGEESPYVHRWQSVLLQHIPEVRAALSSAGPYFKNVCTKLATEVVHRYLSMVMRQRKVSEPATQQLLLDTYNLKTLLLQLHNLGIESVTKVAAPVMFTRLVTSKVSHVETVLKLVGTPDAVLVERFCIMWPQGKGDDLAAVLAVKGTRRADSQRLLEQFAQATGTPVAKPAGDATLGANMSRMTADLGKLGSGMSSMFQSSTVST